MSEIFYSDGILKWFVWHHGSFKHFAGKLSHSRSVSLTFDHFLFYISCNFGSN